MTENKGIWVRRGDLLVVHPDPKNVVTKEYHRVTQVNRVVYPGIMTENVADVFEGRRISAEKVTTRVVVTERGYGIDARALIDKPGVKKASVREKLAVKVLFGR